MKPTRKASILTIAFLATALSASQAQAAERSESGSSSQDSETKSLTPEKHSRASKILDSKIKSQDGQEFGTAEDLIVDNTTGKIQFLVVSQGGTMGMGGDLIPIPWKAATVQKTSEDEQQITLKLTRQQLQSAPALQKDYSNLNDPNFARVINQFYSTSAMGGSESPGGVDQGFDQSTTNAVPDSSGASDSPGGSQYGTSTNSPSSLSSTNR